MGLRLTLHNGERVLLDLPLSLDEWNAETRSLISKELEEVEADLDRICEVCDFFSNKKRLQMVSHMVKEGDTTATFTDLLRVAVNPKYISDLVNHPHHKGFVVKDGHGYRVSPAGLGSFLLLSLGTSKLLEELDSINNDDKSFEED